MNVTIYGEVSNDYFVKGSRVSYRVGGAGYYAAITAMHQGAKVNFLTVYNSKLNKYFMGTCCNMGIEISNAIDDDGYSIPQYLCRGFEGKEKKQSIPLMFDSYELNYQPKLPEGCKALLVFPIVNELPRNLIKEAYESGIPVLLDPKTNAKGIQQTRDVLRFITCLLVNDEELALLTEEHCEANSIQILKNAGVKNIIVKHGIRGCSIYQEKKEPIHQTAYHSEAICKLGSGDVFAGYVTAEFSKGDSLEEIVDRAQCVAAHFIEYLDVEKILRYSEIPDEQKTRKRFENSNGKKIYLSAPFFSMSERLLEEMVYNVLCAKGFDVYSPFRKNGVLNEGTSLEERKDVFKKELREIESSDFIVAILDGNDMGTSFELGYAYQIRKKIFGLYTEGLPLNNMLQIGCYRISSSVEELCKDIGI